MKLNKRYEFSWLAAIAILAGILVGLAGSANAAKPCFIPLIFEGTLVTSVLPQCAEPGDPGFIPLPEEGGNDIFYLIKNPHPDQGLVDKNGNFVSVVEVIASIPEDTAYTGGRWHVQEVFSTLCSPVSPSCELTLPVLTSKQDILDAVDDGIAMIVDTNIDFECPVTHGIFPPPGQGANQP